MIFRIVRSIGAAALAGGICFGGAHAQGQEPFLGKTLTRTFLQHLSASPAVVFPLMSPAGEEKWAYGWNPEFISQGAESGAAGTIFRIHNEEEGEDSIWFLREWDREAWKGEYIIYYSASRLTVLRFILKSDGPDRCQALIAYTWTALTPSGNRFIEQHSGPYFEQYMKLWEASLNHYLKTGQMLKDTTELSHPQKPIIKKQDR